MELSSLIQMLEGWLTTVAIVCLVMIAKTDEYSLTFCHQRKDMGCRICRWILRLESPNYLRFWSPQRLHVMKEAYICRLLPQLAPKIAPPAASDFNVRQTHAYFTNRASGWSFALLFTASVTWTQLPATNKKPLINRHIYPSRYRACQ